MGVDYSAHYGIGFKVELDDRFEEDPAAVIDDMLKESDYAYFEVGQGAYTGKENDYYVVLSDNDSALDEGLIERVADLKRFLIETQLISEDAKADLVGGLQVW